MFQTKSNLQVVKRKNSNTPLEIFCLQRKGDRKKNKDIKKKKARNSQHLKNFS